jgi:AraC-like DNA-binding protein
MNSRTTSSAWVKGVIDMFESAHLDVSALLGAADVDPAMLRDPDARVATEKMSRMWRKAAELSGDPHIGLAHAQVPKPGNFDIVGYAMLSSPDLRAALQSFSRHMRLVSDAADISLHDQGANVLVQFDLYGGREPIPRQRMEFDLLTILTFCRWVSGRPITPVLLSMVYAEPENIQRYADAFQCPLHFGAETNGLVFTQEALNAPLPAYNPMVAELHDTLLQQRLAAFDGAGLSVKVRREIARALATGEPRREAIAHALKISDRTLQRRLRDESATFEKLLDSTRCDLAQHYLSRSNLTVAEVAYLLGFADPGTFFRACKRWFDASPGQFRAQLLEKQKKSAG